jgi:hypothetical protein
LGKKYSQKTAKNKIKFIYLFIYLFEFLGKGASRVKEFREKREFKGQVEYDLSN